MTMIDDTQDLRASVRDLITGWGFVPTCDSWLRSYDPEFSREMGRRGLLGITWPKEVGGGGRPGIARLVVTEEILRTGAPVAGHWIAERQIGPSLLRYGSEVAKSRYVPGIASGKLVFCLGMSETEAGSDLASVRTTATRVDGGWRIAGRKIWTSQAHHATHAYVLARTDKSGVKHEGLSEFIVDMQAEGVEVRPILDLAGEHHFNEVTFDDVFVDDDHVLGEIGNGWAQVTSQLSLERGGIERVMSTYPLLAAARDELAASPNGRESAAAVGRVYARLAALRAMAVRVALDIDAGGSPVTDAAVQKDLGTAFEKAVVEFAREVTPVEPDPDGDGLAGLLAGGILSSPGFTIRGGTSEVLKTLVSRGAPALLTEIRRQRGEVGSAADEMLDGQAGEPEDQAELRVSIEEVGWLRVSVDEAAGGEGGELSDAAEIIEALGRAAVSAPVAESIAATRALARAGRTDLDALGLVTVAGGGDATIIDGTVSGSIPRVPWGREAAHVLVSAVSQGERVWALVPAAAGAWTPGRNLAGEPRDTFTLDGAAVDVVFADAATDAELALFRAVASIGALETACAESYEHITTREQFGRPLLKFQAVAGLFAELLSEFVLARVAVAEAVVAVGAGRADAGSRVAAARAVLDTAATLGARSAHQLHAAMGITREHPLHLSTRRIWSWRDEAGTAAAWQRELGLELLAKDEGAVWAWITAEETS